MASLPWAKGLTRFWVGAVERRRVMLGPFLGTPPPRNDKEKMVAHAVVWVMLILCLLMLLLSVVLPS
jgi:hypothetical protein